MWYWVFDLNLPPSFTELFVCVGVSHVLDRESRTLGLSNKAHIYQ